MSLVGMYGTRKADLDRIIRNEQELLKLASSPLMIYKIKDRINQPSTDDFYSEITQKEFNRPVELMGFFENAVLIQELVKMGIDMEETVTMYFDINAMNDCLGRELAIGDIIRPYHQRNQFYVVHNSYPNQSSERLYQYTQWMVVAEKIDLTGFKIPNYLQMDNVTSWIPFGEHYMTSMLQDRETFLDDREYKIYGDLDYFWQNATFFNLCGEGEAGAFNGMDIYLDFGNAYNFGDSAFTISSFFKPEEIDRFQCLFHKGDDFHIHMLDNGNVEIAIDGTTYTTTTSFYDTVDTWSQIALVVYPPQNIIKLYKDGLPVTISPSTLVTPIDIDNEDSFLIGSSTELTQPKMTYGTGCEKLESGIDYGVESGKLDCMYKGLMSNLRILSVGLTGNEIKDEYDSLISRKFMEV